MATHPKAWPKVSKDQHFKYPIFQVLPRVYSCSDCNKTNHYMIKFSQTTSRNLENFYSDQSGQTTYAGKAQTPRGKSGELHNKHPCAAAPKPFSLLLVGCICLKVPTLDQTQYLWDKSTQKKVIGIQNIFASDFDFIFHNHLSTKKRKNELYPPIH